LQGIHFFLLQLKIKSSQIGHFHHNISILSSNDAIAVKDSYNVIWFAIVVVVGSNEIEIQ
jgi:hypothetical protein